MNSEIKRIIKEIHNKYGSTKRIEARKKYEDQSAEIITNNLGRLTKNQIGKIAELLDTDLWKDGISRGRFGLLLLGRNRKLILANDEKKMNLLFSEVFGRENIDHVEDLISNLKGIGDGFVSCLLYLKNREKHNVFIPATSLGVKTAFPEEPDVRGSFKERYEHFNSLVNELKKECSLEPQEMDIVLVVLPYWTGEVKEETVIEETPLKNWWVEKTYPHTRRTFGEALWSPQRGSDGREVRAYENMRRIKEGDIVLHLADNKAIVGTSIVDKECKKTPYQDEKRKRPGYFVTLRDYQEFNIPIDRSDILNEKYKNRLLSLLESGYYLFYNRTLSLNQGAYLTEAPPPLIEIINEVYKEKNETELPYLTTRTSLRADLRMFDQNFVSEFEKLLREKKQIILFGPPGTSKTFFALEFSKYMAGDRSRFRLVQFHPSYSYEDFVEGITTKAVGGQVEYEITPRIFRTICNEAKNSGKPYILIIDEINRGNLAKIFGELIFSLEYRDHKISLPYSSESLCIPQSLYIIGTMNSADRSIALVDYALRRRFYFVEMLPNEKILDFWLSENNVEIKDKVIKIFSVFNRKIKENEKLGKHFQLGHTYFFVKDVDELKRNWKYAIRPLLEEYFFGVEEELMTFEQDVNSILGE